MRVLLLNLPWNENGRLGVRAGSRWPFTVQPDNGGNLHYIPFPFFMAYATALLKQENKEAKIIDAIAAAMPEETLDKEIKGYNPGLIVIETSTPSFKNDLRITRAIHLNYPESQIALCGPHAGTFCQEILNEYDFINYIFIGEYEFTLLELLGSLESGSNLESVLGLAYRDDQNIKVNNPRPAIDNLDRLPWPERRDLPIYKYNDGFAGLPQPNCQMLSSRGCPFRCTYCLWPQTMYGERRFRARDPIKVVDEMEYLVKGLGFKAVYFDDDLFNADRNHLLNICKEIKKRKLYTPWAAMARADLLDYKTLQEMKDAGIYALKYGIESVNQEVLNACGKNLEINRARSVIAHTKRLGIRIHLAFCVGLPGETKQTFCENIHFVEETNPDSFQFSFATPFPGTEYYEFVREKGWLMTQEWADYDGNQKCIVRTESLTSEDLEYLRNNAYNFKQG